MLLRLYFIFGLHFACVALHGQSFKAEPKSRVKIFDDTHFKQSSGSKGIVQNQFFTGHKKMSVMPGNGFKHQRFGGNLRTDDGFKKGALARVIPGDGFRQHKVGGNLRTDDGFKKGVMSRVTPGDGFKVRKVGGNLRTDDGFRVQKHTRVSPSDGFVVKLNFNKKKKTGGDDYFSVQTREHKELSDGFVSKVKRQKSKKESNFFTSEYREHAELSDGFVSKVKSKKQNKETNYFSSETREHKELSDGFTVKVGKKKKYEETDHFSSAQNTQNQDYETDHFAGGGKGGDPRPWYKRGDKLNLALLFKPRRTKLKDKKHDPDDSFTLSRRNEQKMRNINKKSHETGLFQKGVLPNSR